jgi:peptide/nickel transport system substrate-binding protein
LHSTGAFRAGPPIAEFEELIGRFAVATDLGTLGELTADIDRFVHDQALSVFLCAPQALYAVNRHVAFGGYAATFELAETEASPQHWSRRKALRASRRCGLVDAVLLPPVAATVIG